MTPQSQSGHQVWWQSVANVWMKTVSYLNRPKGAKMVPLQGVYSPSFQGFIGTPTGRCWYKRSFQAVQVLEIKTLLWLLSKKTCFASQRHQISHIKYTSDEILGQWIWWYQIHPTKQPTMGFVICCFWVLFFPFYSHASAHLIPFSFKLAKSSVLSS